MKRTKVVKKEGGKERTEEDLKKTQKKEMKKE